MANPLTQIKLWKAVIGDTTPWGTPTEETNA
jgi:hypothetical protein